MSEYASQSNALVDYETNSSSQTNWHPKFLDDEASVRKEYKEEWRTYLVMKNWEQISSSMPADKRVLRFSFYSKTVVKRVFDLCEMMRQAPEVRYLALDILDRFMIPHFFNVARAVEESTDRTQEIWKTVLKRMVNQTFSRVLSSIQLASKYCRSARVLSNAEIEKILISSGQRYVFSRRELVKSEARVYKTLKYKDSGSGYFETRVKKGSSIINSFRRFYCSIKLVAEVCPLIIPEVFTLTKHLEFFQMNIPLVTPLTYVEMFFEDFRSEEVREHLQLTLSSFLNVCVHVLDVAFIFHKEIYSTLYSRLTGKPYLILKDPQFLSVEADYMYLAASVIHTAATIQDPSQAVPLELLKFFSSITQYKPEEIEMLGKVILEIIIKL